MVAVSPQVIFASRRNESGTASGIPPAHCSPVIAVASQQSVLSMRRGRSRMFPIPPPSTADILALGLKMGPSSGSFVVSFGREFLISIPYADQYTPGARGNQSDRRKLIRQTEAK